MGNEKENMGKIKITIKNKYFPPATKFTDPSLRTTDLFKIEACLQSRWLFNPDSCVFLIVNLNEYLSERRRDAVC